MLMEYISPKKLQFAAYGQFVLVFTVKSQLRAKKNVSTEPKLNFEKFQIA